jgi:hypothetical protein
MINMTESDFGRNLTALLTQPPVRALKGGALGFVTSAVPQDTPWVADRIHKAAVDLLTSLDVGSIYDVPDGLARLKGRPPKAVIDAMRSPDLVDAVRGGLCQLGYPDLMDLVSAWGPTGEGPMATVELSASTLRERTELVDALRVRAQEILAAWGAAGLEIGVGSTRVDGRTLAVAARVWQIPLVTGQGGDAPMSVSALYANRLGRSAAAVAFMKIAQAAATHAPVEAVSGPLALLVALGEAIMPGDPDSEVIRVAASKGELQPCVQVGGPVVDRSLDVHRWWPIFSAWGSSERRGAVPFPTAWRLSTAQADVFLWVLTRVAVALAVAASAPRRAGYLLVPFDWAAHVEREAPAWVQGADAVCSLMQRGRLPQLRTEMPGGLLPDLGDAGAWPWRAPAQ